MRSYDQINNGDPKKKYKKNPHEKSTYFLFCLKFAWQPPLFNASSSFFCFLSLFFFFFCKGSLMWQKVESVELQNLHESQSHKHLHYKATTTTNYNHHCKRCVLLAYVTVLMVWKNVVHCLKAVVLSLKLLRIFFLLVWRGLFFLLNYRWAVVKEERKTKKKL